MGESERNGGTREQKIKGFAQKNSGGECNNHGILIKKTDWQRQPYLQEKREAKASPITKGMLTMMNEEIRIVPTEAKYVEDCARIAMRAWEPIHESYKKCLGADLHDELMPTWREDKARATRNIHGTGNAFVALMGDEVVGYCSYGIDGILGEIKGNSVNPDLRGRGIANKLYNAVLDKFRAEGCKYATVHTGLDEGHGPARRAYNKVGFELNLPSVIYYQRLDPNMQPYATSSDTVQVVPAQEAHVADCKRIALTAWNIIHDSYRNCIGREMHDELLAGWEERLEDAIVDRMRSGQGYVALVDGKVAGFASYRADGKMGIVGYNAVDPEYRGRSIAKLLYGMLINRMVEEGCVYARVHTGLDDGHASARRAYNKVGFELNLPSIRYYQKL